MEQPFLGLFGSHAMLQAVARVPQLLVPRLGGQGGDDQQRPTLTADGQRRANPQEVVKFDAPATSRSAKSGLRRKADISAL